MKLTEKQKNCPYCQEPKMTFIGEDGVLYQVSEDAFTTPKLITITNGQTHIVKIEYCPMCGRSLKEEEK
ncbi:hypothetical protein [Limosilactobacillus reuteri]|uniref:Uncharacterized protein n=1 Tax=Limosilactobacillus reuteri TaxID=1598 RepID=A0AAW9U5F6_LIMRT|nr:hypothetical protein [Limosilactobacillus reuteri]MCC4508529.1 hypothetical protein [Limosilactobacillus reuteri]MCR1878029.1 hypothetical protein [Limosilactobacillus reuteri]MRG74530.1 hypothetical protein [Limosilactobacillus reuteri]OUL52014.1 hypothetical protein B2G46_10225 [Limosilactobacillus reuteri]